MQPSVSVDCVTLQFTSHAGNSASVSLMVPRLQLFDLLLSVCWQTVLFAVTQARAEVQTVLSLGTATSRLNLLGVFFIFFYKLSTPIRRCCGAGLGLSCVSSNPISRQCLFGSRACMVQRMEISISPLSFSLSLLHSQPFLSALSPERRRSG